jgi:hypothetical protein
MLSEQDVILKTGIPRSTYWSWKDGTCEPKGRESWIRLAAVFKLSVDEVMTGMKSVESSAEHLKEY